MDLFGSLRALFSDPSFSTLAFSSTACPFPSAWARGKERAPTRLRHFRKIRLIIQLIESWLLEFSLFLNLPMVFTGNRFYIFSLVESLHRQRIRKLSTTPRSYDPPVSLPHRPPTVFCQELGSTVNGAWSSY